MNKSGVLGIFEVSSDMRELEDAVARGEERAQLAENMYFYRIKNTSVLLLLHWVVMTSSCVYRWGRREPGNLPCRRMWGLEAMGVKIDEPYNATIRGKETIISTADSKVKVVVIPTDERVYDCFGYDDHLEIEICFHLYNNSVCASCSARCFSHIVHVIVMSLSEQQAQAVPIDFVLSLIFIY